MRVQKHQSWFTLTIAYNSFTRWNIDVPDFFGNDFRTDIEITEFHISDPYA